MLSSRFWKPSECWKIHKPWLFSIVTGPDGALWFTQQAGNKIGRLTPAGVFNEFPLPTPGSQPFGIAVGPDAALWYTQLGGNRIGRMTTAGVITEYAIPTAGSQPRGIAAGPDGKLAQDQPHQHRRRDHGIYAACEQLCLGRRGGC